MVLSRAQRCIILVYGLGVAGAIIYPPWVAYWAGPFQALKHAPLWSGGPPSVLERLDWSRLAAELLGLTVVAACLFVLVTASPARADKQTSPLVEHPSVRRERGTGRSVAILLRIVRSVVILILFLLLFVLVITLACWVHAVLLATP